MHILHVIDSLNIGGAERAAIDLANATAKNGFRVSFCTTRYPGALAAELFPSVDVYHLHRKKRLDWSAIRRFRHIVSTNQVDIVQAHMRSTAAFMTFLKTLGELRTPLLFQDHHGGIEIDQSVPNWLSLWGRHVIDGYVGVYPKLCQWAKNAGFAEGKINYVGYAIDLSRLISVQAVDVHYEFGLPIDRPVGIIVGNIRVEKGIDTVIQSIGGSAIAKRASYIIAGRDADPQYAQRCRELVTQLKLQDIVHFVGLRHDVPSLLRGVDFAVMPSRSESGPLVLVEYLAVGLPFVAFEVGDLANQIAQKGIPGFVPPGNSQRLIRALENLLELTPDQRIRRGAIGRKIAEDHFSIESKLSEWQQVYQKLLL